MRISMRRRTRVMALGVVLVSLAGATPAQAAPNWRVAALPQLELSSRLVDVSATGPDGAWAVGYQGASYGAPPPPRPYALLQWNGNSWTERLLSDDVSTLSGVSATTASDVWTVGQDRQLAPYAARWNGSAWQGYRPLGQDTASTLFDVAADGGRAVLVGGNAHPLILEWDGQRFTRATVPGADAWPGTLYGVTTAPDGATFAVGAWHVEDAAYPEPMIVQRTGSAWQVATLPTVPSARLLGVWARSATDAWAVGTADYDSAPKPLIMRWNGTTWRRVTAPVAAGSLGAVAGDQAGNLWISGANPVPPYVEYPGSLFLRYTGGRWSAAYGPKVNNADPYLSALTNIPGTSTFWGVGAVWDPVAESRALIERIG
ncbi:hypothetical protein C6361_16770 [Plantactinospora sp. BC1]|uniref:hypothetical protein n=1 Tax=Plantactinospora sp. BC1 TaxID=2108470 RepID=UPI000D155A3B|nr:hypothetical protein [Plantactinospora sp. BC1]AVT30864.1 hypothetical protein C6361_16770 [Plantactinospora sp. BC1]